jgi:non-canonical poly(A) RNA polymerase PAPD5/7
LSLNMSNGLESVDVVLKYLQDRELGVVVHAFMLILKQFLVQRHLNEVFTGGIGGYALLVMIVVFLKVLSLEDSIEGLIGLDPSPHPSQSLGSDRKLGGFIGRIL